MSEERKRGYLIVGAGAIGGTLAFYLARAGHHIIAVDVDVDHVAAIRGDGITLLRHGARESAPLTIATPDEAVIAKASRVLLCVKGVGATERAADWIAPRLAPNGFVVSLQNGLQMQQIEERIGPHRTVGAFVDFFADILAPGVIADGGAGTLRVGEVDGTRSTRVEQTVADLQAWGPARATDNILGYLWSKLGFSAMLAATALADEPMAEVIDRHRDVMVALAREVFDVARAHGITLERFDAFDPALLRGSSDAQDVGIDRLVAWLRQQPKTRSGVWRDIAIRHRPTEAVGRYMDVIRRAHASGVPAAHLERLVCILREVESGMRAMSHDNLGDVRQDNRSPRPA
jgi:2-dehydropantoate 2-reductase